MHMRLHPQDPEVLVKGYHVLFGEVSALVTPHLSWVMLVPLDDDRQPVHELFLIVDPDALFPIRLAVIHDLCKLVLA